MRWIAALTVVALLAACAEGTGSRRVAGGGAGGPPDETARIADAVLSTPIGYVDDRAPRTALVIGNARYTAIPRLANPANDAELVSRTLRGLGFRLEGGGPQLDLTGAQMRAAVANYRRTLASRGGVGLVYFAGHAVQIDGRNWLAPADADPRSAADIARQFLPAEALFGQSTNAGAVNMVILDACRDNPFEARSGARSSPIPGLRGTSAGLSRVVAPPDTLVAFATAPGDVALDGSGANSPYAAALSRALAQPGARVEDVFINVRNIVERSTEGQQTPWETSSLTKRVVLNANQGEFKSASAGFDGRFAGILACGDVPGSANPDGWRKAISVSITDGRGTFLSGPETPISRWNGGQLHERVDFVIQPSGKVVAAGKYSKFAVDRPNGEEDVGDLLIEDSILFRGQIEDSQMSLAGQRGSRRCTLSLARL